MQRDRRTRVGLLALTLASGSALAGVTTSTWSQNFVQSEPFPQNWSFDGVDASGAQALSSNIRLGILTDGNGSAGVLGSEPAANPVTSTALAFSSPADDCSVTAIVNPLGLIASGRQGVVARYDSTGGYVAAIDYGSGELVLARFDRLLPSFTVLANQPLTGFATTNTYAVRINVTGSFATAYAAQRVNGEFGVPVIAASPSPINGTPGGSGPFVRADSQASPAEMRFSSVSQTTNHRSHFIFASSEDLFFTNGEGELWTWGLVNSFLSSAIQQPGIPAGFEVATSADFNDDRRSDPVIHNRATGQTRVLLSNTQDGSYSSRTLPTVAADTWDIAGSGDMNFDGIPDLLYRNANSVWIRTMTRSGNSSNLSLATIETKPILVPGAGWTLQAVGDFGGDGFNDMFFRNTDGSNGVVSFIGSNAINWVPMPWAPVGWEVVGTGDFNDDRRNDLIWQNTDGRLVQWTLDGTTITSSTELPSAGESYRAAN
jgi:hypothetical protein